jgi:hypothetical protein
MTKKIEKLAKLRAGLGEIPFRGEYAGTDEIQHLNICALTEEELTCLFEFCIRYDEHKSTADTISERISRGGLS